MCAGRRPRALAGPGPASPPAGTRPPSVGRFHVGAPPGGLSDAAWAAHAAPGTQRGAEPSSPAPQPAGVQGPGHPWGGAHSDRMRGHHPRGSGSVPLPCSHSVAFTRAGVRPPGGHRAPCTVVAAACAVHQRPVHTGLESSSISNGLHCLECPVQCPLTVH